MNPFTICSSVELCFTWELIALFVMRRHVVGLYRQGSEWMGHFTNLPHRHTSIVNVSVMRNKSAPSWVESQSAVLYTLSVPQDVTDTVQLVHSIERELVSDQTIPQAIKACFLAQRPQPGLDLWRRLLRNKVRPSSATMRHALGLAAQGRDAYIGKEILELMISRGIEVSDAVLADFVRCFFGANNSQFSDLFEVWNTLNESKGEKSFRTMMSLLRHFQREDLVVNTLREMDRLDVPLSKDIIKVASDICKSPAVIHDLFSFFDSSQQNEIFKSHAHLAYVHGRLSISPVEDCLDILQLDPCNQSAKVLERLFRACFQEKDLLSALSIRKHVINHSIPWTNDMLCALIDTFRACKQYQQGINLINELDHDRRSLNAAVYVSLLKCSEQLNHLSLSLTLWNRMLEDGIKPDYHCYLCLVIVYSRSGEFQRAIDVIVSMKSRFKLTSEIFSKVVAEMSRRQNIHFIAQLEELMRSLNIEPDIGFLAEKIRLFLYSGFVSRAIEACEELQTCSQSLDSLSIVMLAETWTLTRNFERLGHLFDRVFHDEKLWSVGIAKCFHIAAHVFGDAQLKTQVGLMKKGLEDKALRN